MSDELEAVGTMAEAALVGSAVEKATGENLHSEAGGKCLNCGVLRDGTYCSNCGQSAHIHRSISAFWHDILHGVLHFDGKFWRTIPLLVWRPGELTRRYVRGERAKFISPMALFLFAIFMMFAIFSFMPNGISDTDSSESTASESAVPKAENDATETDGTIGNNAVVVSKTAVVTLAEGKAKLDTQIAKAEEKLASDTVAPEEVTAIREEIKGMKFARSALDKISNQEEAYPDNNSDTIDEETIEQITTESDWLGTGIKKAQENPEFLLYKLKSNGYKFAWLLIPLSIPFVWLATIGVRGHRFYDHAVFCTYSLAFMSLLFIAGVLLNAIGVPTPVLAIVGVFYPLFHVYKQLRHAYALSRLATVIRMFFLLQFMTIVVVMFSLILLTLGILT